jgi:predicted DCC family thiol-disulfide oxidoreductase YuxK
MPVLVYDGDCGFCTWVAAFGARMLPASVDVVPYQRADLPSLGLSLPEVETAVQWVSPGRAAQSGHRAIAAWFLASGFPWSVLGRLLLLPGVSWVAGRIYHVISVNRHRIPGPWRRGGARCPSPAHMQ